MNIAFYIDEMNFRGVANSTFQYAFYNEKILKNKSIIFFNNKNYRNRNITIKKFKSYFKVVGISEFSKIDNYLKKLRLDFVYSQKSGNKDNWISNKINTLAHSLYPQSLSQVHGYKYFYVSDWLSKNFSNNKIKYLPYIVNLHKTKKNLRKKLMINKKSIVFGCHGGDSSFDLKFTHDAIIDLVKRKKNIYFLFLNINQFYKHPNIIFLKGVFDEKYKKQFLNSCDAMLYGRSLGESFGLSCGEFSYLEKPIISYKFNRHRAHIDQISKSGYLEYGSRHDLQNILNNFKKNNKKLHNRKNKYINNKPEKVMKVFNNLLKHEKISINFNILDYIINYSSFLVMSYYYLRHKFYNHYYKYLESILIYKKK